MSVPGFCGRPAGKWGPPAPNPPMSTDPNADLIGYRFPVDTGGGGTVVGSAPWDSNYVYVTTEAGLTVRAATLLRRRKELSS